MALRPVYQESSQNIPTQQTVEPIDWTWHEGQTRGKKIEYIQGQIGHWNGKHASLEGYETVGKILVLSGVVGEIFFGGVLATVCGISGDWAPDLLWGILLGIPGLALAPGLIFTLVSSVKKNNYLSAKLDAKKIAKLKKEVEAENTRAVENLKSNKALYEKQIQTINKDLATRNARFPQAVKA